MNPPPSEDENDLSEHDKRVQALTGFTPAPREKRHCVMCDQPGHYYYECNGGAFLGACDALVGMLKTMPDTR